jgi:hypothetical protein
MLKNRKNLAAYFIVAVFIVLIIIYGKLDPESSPVFPKCPFRLLTNYECPGCGSQRAIHHLLNLKIGSAICANALLVFAIPYILLLFLAELLKLKNRFFMRLHNVFFSVKAIWAAFATVVLWWILRNIW